MTAVGIVGVSGYVGGEILRLLLQHSKVEVVALIGKESTGKKVSEIHRDLIACDLIIEANPRVDLDVVFFAVGHGKTSQILQKMKLKTTTKIIDLSSDFRLKKTFEHRKVVYGISELNKSAIMASDFIANPGCFATVIQLALFPILPFVGTNEIHINGITGSTGAGKSFCQTSHFSDRIGNVSAYKVLEHQHLGEINLQLFSDPNHNQICFIPQRGAFSRGIWISVYFNYSGHLQQIKNAFKDAYADSRFVHLADNPIGLKQVVNTNNCIIHADHVKGKIIVFAAIDNLIKGAAGQAVQNLNLMMGWNESEGLRLKSSVF